MLDLMVGVARSCDEGAAMAVFEDMLPGGESVGDVALCFAVLGFCWAEVRGVAMGEQKAELGQKQMRAGFTRQQFWLTCAAASGGCRHVASIGGCAVGARASVDSVANSAASGEQIKIYSL